FERVDEHAGDVAARTRHARHIAALDGIEVDGEKHDRQIAGDRAGGAQGGLIADCHDDIGLACSELAIAGLVVVDARRADVFEAEVASFLIAELRHSPDEGSIDRGVAPLRSDETDAEHFARRRLRPCGERPSYGAPEEGNELTTSHGIERSDYGR